MVVGVTMVAAMVADAIMALATIFLAAATIAVSGSSFYCSSVAEIIMTVVDATMAVATVSLVAAITAVNGSFGLF